MNKNKYCQGVRAVVLAAGKSSRFKRSESKLLSKICGQSMIVFPLRILQDLKIPTTIVVGFQADKIKKEVCDSFESSHDFVLQEELSGTGSALVAAQPTLDSEDILILNGDVPLLTASLIEELLTAHSNKKADITFVSTHVLDPSGYGRVIEENGIRIYEERDCPDKYRCEKRINAGIYVIKKKFLEKFLNKIEKSPVSGEFYLTDLIAFASDNDFIVKTISAPFDTVRGVNTLQELWAVEQVSRSNLIKYWMDRGVRFELAQSIHIDIDVEIGPDSFIGTGAHIMGKTKIGENCFVSAFSIIENATIGDRTTIYSHSVIQDGVIGNDVKLGPFARLRNNVVVGNSVSIGNFVEVKNSSIGDKTKTKHLSYIGDATIGKNVNIGAGTIVCNYDGKEKHKTTIGDGAFVGSNDTLVAPVKIGKGSYIAAGSTVTSDVPAGDLAIARARQENKKDYAKKISEKGS